MKLMIVSGLLLSLAVGQHKISVSDFAWIEGHWEHVKGDLRTDEVWLPPSGNTMIGISKTVRGERTAEYEFVVLDQDSAGTIHYNAYPSGQPGGSFKLVHSEHRSAVFENLQHDFPQRIIYKRISDDSLYARIEGSVGGKLRGIDFPYRKKQ